jgi:hypothetical protein
MIKRFYPAVVLACAALLAGCATQAQFASNDALELVGAPGTPLASVWSQQAGGVILVSGKPAGFVATRASYTNYRLTLDWRWPGAPGNAGVLLHIASGPKDGVWPLSVQAQTKHGFAGDVLPMAGAAFAEPLTTAPGAYPAIKGRLGADSEKPVGEWNSLEIVSLHGAIEVKVNGVLQNRVTGSSPGTGRIGFQLEGTQYELRNLQLTPLF